MRLSPILALGLVALSATGCPFEPVDPIVPVEPDFVAELSGQAEVPPVQTETVGETRFALNAAGDGLDFVMEIDRGDRVLGAAGAHLHCAPEGRNGPVVAFLAGEVPGGFDGRLEIRATITGANITNDVCGATFSELVDAMFDGRVYVNVHSTGHPAGVVRGQVTPL